MLAMSSKKVKQGYSQAKMLLGTSVIIHHLRNMPLIKCPHGEKGECGGLISSKYFFDYVLPKRTCSTYFAYFCSAAVHKAAYIRGATAKQPSGLWRVLPHVMTI